MLCLSIPSFGEIFRMTHYYPQFLPVKRPIYFGFFWFFFFFWKSLRLFQGKKREKSLSGTFFFFWRIISLTENFFSKKTRKNAFFLKIWKGKCGSDFFKNRNFRPFFPYDFWFFSLFFFAKKSIIKNREIRWSM
jgi:hypothetical protein